MVRPRSDAGRITPRRRRRTTETRSVAPAAFPLPFLIAPRPPFGAARSQDVERGTGMGDAAPPMLANERAPVRLVLTFGEAARGRVSRQHRGLVCGRGGGLILRDRKAAATECAAQGGRQRPMRPAIHVAAPARIGFAAGGLWRRGEGRSTRRGPQRRCRSRTFRSCGVRQLLWTARYVRVALESTKEVQRGQRLPAAGSRRVSDFSQAAHYSGARSGERETSVR